MVTMMSPVFRELDRAAMLGVLARSHVGRLAFADGARVDVQPIHYVMSDGWIYGRTSPGSKLDAMRRNWRVAFEVDEIDGLYEWRSVVVHGGFYRLSPNGTPTEAARWRAAVDALRTLIPETLTDVDPVPFRSELFGIAVQDMTGRAATVRAG